MPTTEKPRTGRATSGARGGAFMMLHCIYDYRAATAMLGVRTYHCFEFVATTCPRPDDRRLRQSDDPIARETSGSAQQGGSAAPAEEVGLTDTPESGSNRGRRGFTERGPLMSRPLALALAQVPGRDPDDLDGFAEHATTTAQLYPQTQLLLYPELHLAGDDR